MAEVPKVSGLAYHLSRPPGAVHGIGRIRAILLEITGDLVDFDRFEARNRDIEILMDEEFGEFGQLHRKELPVPAGILGNLVVGQEQRAFFCFAEAFEDDHRYLAKIEQLRGLETTVPRNDHSVLICEQSNHEAEGKNAIGDLADLLLRMCVCVTWVGRERVRRNPLDLVLL